MQEQHSTPDGFSGSTPKNSSDLPSAAEDTLVVSELFGPTLQGEGPSAGRRAAFLRLGGCNLHCRFCDSAYTWDAGRFDLRGELSRAPVEEVVSGLLACGTGLVVITGGEPLLHQRQGAWRWLLDELAAAGREVEIETNGTIAPTAHTAARTARFNVSPKLAFAGDPERARIRPEALAALAGTGKAIFKIVCRTPGHVDQAAALAAEYGLGSDRLWVMPEGVTAEAMVPVLERITARALARGANVSARLQVLLWEGRRGC